MPNVTGSPSLLLTTPLADSNAERNEQPSPSDRPKHVSLLYFALNDVKLQAVMSRGPLKVKKRRAHSKCARGRPGLKYFDLRHRCGIHVCPSHEGYSKLDTRPASLGLNTQTRHWKNVVEAKTLAAVLLLNFLAAFVATNNTPRTRVYSRVPRQRVQNRPSQLRITILISSNCTMLVQHRVPQQSGHERLVTHHTMKRPPLYNNVAG